MLSTPTKSPRPFNSISKKQKYEILVEDMSPRKNLFDDMDSDVEMNIQASDFKLKIDQVSIDVSLNDT